MKRQRAVRESVPPFFVGAVGVRIATTSLRTGCGNDTLYEMRYESGRADRVVRPYAAIRGVVRDRVGRPQGSPLRRVYKRRGWSWHIVYAYITHIQYTPAKASQSLPPAGGKKFQIIFHRDMCAGKNTSQAASVEFCRLRQNYARSRLQTPLAENSVGIFCQ